MCEVVEEEGASSFFEVSLGKSRLSLVSGQELGWTLTVALAVSDFQAFQIRELSIRILRTKGRSNLYKDPMTDPECTE